MRVPFDPSAQPVAVSPVASLSPEPEDERLCADLTADLIAGLTQYRKVRTTSARPERGYLLTGTLRRAGDRLRLLLQLGDGRGGVLWSERLDGLAGTLRSDLGATLCARLAAQLATLDRSLAVPPDGPAPDARGLVRLGQALGQRYTRLANLAARRLFAEAAAADPGYAPAYAGLSRTYHRAWRYGWAEDAADPLERAVEMGRAAVDRDPLDARGHAALASALLYRSDFEAALAAFAHATALNPNDPDILAEHADAWVHAGEPRRAFGPLERAMRLNACPPDWYRWYLAGAFFALDQPDEVVATIARMGDASEGWRLLAATFARLGDAEAARAAAREVLRLYPGFTVAAWAQRLPDRSATTLERFADGLHRAGLP